VTQSDLLDAIVTLLRPDADPEEPPPPQQNIPGAGAPGTPAPPPRRLRILVAEDNPVNQQVARKTLERAGHAVTLVADGEAALAALKQEAFDLVLMDVQMPGMDGFAATRALREHEQAAGGHTPVVAMTAHAMKGDRERCLQAGMDGYVSKPLDRRKLFEAIEALAPAAPPAAPGRRAAVDRGRLWARVEGDAALLRELIEIFLETTPRLMADLGEAVERRDAEALGDLAHAVKGAVGNFAADLAHRAALALEQIGRSGDLAEAAEMYETLKQEMEAVAAELRRELDAPAPTEGKPQTKNQAHEAAP